MTDAAEALNLSLVADGPELDDDETRAAWTIDGDRTAEWALRKLAHARAEIQRVKEVAADEIDRITSWRDRAIRGAESDAAFFEGQLERYHRTLVADDKAVQSYKLPAGTLKLSKSRDKVEITDLDALRDFAEGNTRLELVRITVEPDKRALAEVLAAGEIIPGATLVRGEAMAVFKAET